MRTNGTFCLSDILVPQAKSKIKAGEGLDKGEYRFFTSSNIQSKFIDTAIYYEAALIFGTGGNASIHYCDEPFSTSTDCVVFYAKDKQILKTIYLYLYSNMQILESGFKGAGLRHISKEYIMNIQVPKMTAKEQIQIAEIFECINKVINKRKLQLLTLDLLVKSRFIEMFGDIPKSEYVSMKEVCSIITDGTHQPPKFVSDGIPFIFVSNLANNEVTYNVEKYITDETYNELIKRTPIEVGDILLSTVGSYGHPAVVKNDKRFLFQRHIAYLKPKKVQVDSIYLYGFLLSADGQQQIKDRVKGIAQKTLNLSEIKKLMLPLPTMDTQTQFSAFVNQVDKSKFVFLLK
ncbi:MAG: restriction endonuclease subunit S [Oscillospiraceae bacterium]